MIDEGLVDKMLLEKTSWELSKVIPPTPACTPRYFFLQIKKSRINQTPSDVFHSLNRAYYYDYFIN